MRKFQRRLEEGYDLHGPVFEAWKASQVACATSAEPTQEERIGGNSRDSTVGLTQAYDMAGTFDIPVLLNALTQHGPLEQFAKGTDGFADSLSIFMSMSAGPDGYALGKLYRHHFGENFAARDAGTDVAALARLLQKKTVQMCMPQPSPVHLLLNVFVSATILVVVWTALAR